ncbi:uncharacterized protein LOC117651996 [Thrips palmi]|uniref:Uncharacterized protein LOC117651996 n=1 Tax=Thrips palmi TaxID=161013 RepID=A0A6P9A3P4_THRPL|nr:uncharacterized protein LOC117651996 [Thrips palmi]
MPLQNPPDVIEAHQRSARVARASRCSSKSASRTCRATRTTRAHNPKDPSCGRGTFGYDIEDVDSFLAKASLEKPANIPMVLACPCTLYRTEEGGWQEEVSLPLGMVVNGVFRVEASPSSSSCWLYAQTPHGHEGYVRYASCLPLGILAASAEAAPRDSTPRPLPTPSWSRGWGRGPSWDTASDILPATYTGNLTDTSKAKDTRSERAFNCARGTTRTLVDKGLQFQQGLLEASRAERSVDELYLRSMRSGNTPLYAGGSIHFSSAIKVC